MLVEVRYRESITRPSASRRAHVSATRTTRHHPYRFQNAFLHFQPIGDAVGNRFGSKQNVILSVRLREGLR